MSKPAFPRPYSTDFQEKGGYSDDQQGMSLLEWYTGQALPSVVEKSLNSPAMLKKNVDDFNGGIANTSVNIAEAVIKELERRNK